MRYLENFVTVLTPNHKRKCSMKNAEIEDFVKMLFRKVEESNRAERFKTLLSFMTYRGGKLFDFGVYNYKTKKYVLTYAHSLQIDRDLKELEQFVLSNSFRRGR